MYRQYSEQSMKNQKTMSNFNDTYERPRTLVHAPNFKNTGEFLDNNIHENLLLEHETNIRININTKDRDTSIYPSPFNIRVKFGDSTKNPSIQQNYKNVRFISLCNVILPRTVAIDITHVDEPNLYPTDSGYSSSAGTTSIKLTTLSNHKYLLLTIKELDTDTISGTSDIINRKTIVLVYDSDLGLDGGLWKPINHETISFPFSSLKQIRELTFHLTDENGNDINIVDQDGNVITGSSVTSLDGTNYNTFVSNNNSINSVSYTDTVTQVLYCLSFIIIEPELNTFINH